MRKKKKKREKTYRNSMCSRLARLGYGLNGWGFEFQNVRKVYFLSRNTKVVLRFTQPPALRVLETLSPAVKRLKRQVVHSNPSGTEVNNEWKYTGQCIVIYSYNKINDLY